MMATLLQHIKLDEREYVPARRRVPCHAITGIHRATLVNEYCYERTQTTR